MASCDNCAKGYFLPGETTGSIVADMDGAYFAPGPEGSTSRTVVYLTDVFGLPLKNSKLMADELAKALACDVWVPDLFNGAPLSPCLPRLHVLNPPCAQASRSWPWTSSSRSCPTARASR